MSSIEMFDRGVSANIKVIGVGGGGGNAVDYMVANSVQGVEFICANTDAQDLDRKLSGLNIRLGNTGLGAGNKPEMGREAAEAASDEIRQAISGANMLFITAGMGGGTGTGAAPVIARIAKDMRILTVAVVTKPFDFEGRHRMQNAEAGLAELEANVDSLVVVLNEKLMEVLGDDVTQDEAFAAANDVLRNAVDGIAGIINNHGLVNVDFADVRTVMSYPGKAILGTAMASGPDRARIAAEQAIASPLLEGVDLADAKGILVLVRAARSSLKMRETKEAVATATAMAAQDCKIIPGVAYDDSLGDEIRVTVVATGLTNQNARRQPVTVLQGGLRTGTDNMAYAAPVAGQVGAVGMGVQAAQSGFDPAIVPSVWSTRRTGGDRTYAAARVGAMASSGMEDIEIPAFLRRQAD